MVTMVVDINKQVELEFQQEAERILQESYVVINNRQYKLSYNAGELPDYYIVWNIGRELFPLKGFLPVCFFNNQGEICKDTLTALYVGSEETALELIKKSLYMDEPMTIVDVRREVIK